MPSLAVRREGVPTAPTSTLRRYSLIQAASAVVAVVFTVMQMEVVLGNRPRFPPTKHLGAVNALRFLTTVATGVTLWALAVYAREVLQYLRRRCVIQPGAPWWRVPEGRLLAFEMVLCAVHPFPWLEEVTTDPAVLVVLTLLVTCRLYLAARVAYWSSLLTSTPARAVASMVNLRFSPLVVAKVWTAVHPARLAAVAAAFLLIVLSYWLHLVDTARCDVDTGLGCDPVGYVDSVWVVVLTITTVGYGLPDVPQSDAGKAVGVVIALVGVVTTLIALAVTVLALEPTLEEAYVLSTLNSMASRETLRHRAAVTIQAAFRYHVRFQSSLSWRHGACGTRYRPVAQRLPLENHSLSSRQSFQLTRGHMRSQFLNSAPGVVQARSAHQLLVNMQALNGEVEAMFPTLQARPPVLRRRPRPVPPTPRPDPALEAWARRVKGRLEDTAAFLRTSMALQA